MPDKRGLFWLTLALGGALLLWPAPQPGESRLERARTEAAEQLAEFYTTGENWYSCWQALRRLERLEERRF